MTSPTLIESTHFHVGDHVTHADTGERFKVTSRSASAWRLVFRGGMWHSEVQRADGEWEPYIAPDD